MTWHPFCVGQLFWDVTDGPIISPLKFLHWRKWIFPFPSNRQLWKAPWWEVDVYPLGFGWPAVKPNLQPLAECILYQIHAINSLTPNYTIINMKALEICSPTFYIITVYVLFISITFPHKTQKLPFIWTELLNFPFWLWGRLSLSSRVCLGFPEQVISLQLLPRFSVTGPTMSPTPTQVSRRLYCQRSLPLKGNQQKDVTRVKGLGRSFSYLVLVSKVGETS